VPPIEAVPGATPVNVTVHAPALKVHEAPTVPTGVFDEVKLTLPPGTFEGVVVSLTVTAHAEVPVRMIVVGLQAMLIEALSLVVAVTVTVAEALVLVLWVASPP